MSSIFQELVDPDTGAVEFVTGTGAIPGTAASFRGLFVEQDAAPFGVYASTGQEIDHQGAGGLTFDEDGRLRIVTSAPSGLTRTNLLQVEDITDVGNWNPFSITDVKYLGDGIFRLINVGNGSGQQIRCPTAKSGESVDGEDASFSVQVRATPNSIGKTFITFVDRESGGASVAQNEVITLTEEWQTVTEKTTGVSLNTGWLLLFYVTDAGNYDVEVRFPTIETATGYPAGYLPMVIPTDGLRGVSAGAITVPATVELMGGIVASGPTGELVASGDVDLIYQGVGITNEGYIAQPASGPPAIMSDAVAWFDETTIQDFTTLVLAWNNKGTGGSDYDLDTVVGTNPTYGATQNGLNIVTFGGSASLETTTGQLVSSPGVVIVVAKWREANPTTNQFLFDAQSGTTQRWVIYEKATSSDDWHIFQGGELRLVGSFDNDPHVFIGEFEGDGATTEITVSDVGSRAGNAGTQDFLFGTLGGDNAGNNELDGWVAEVLVWDKALTPTEISDVTAYLETKWGL